MYTMDSRNQMLFGYYCFDNADFTRASIALMARGLRSDGLLELCFPASVPITIPCFSLLFPILLDEYITHTGDASAAGDFLSCASSILQAFLDRRNDKGLVPAFGETPYWNFYEWSEGLDGGAIFRVDPLAPSLDAPLNAFLSAALRSYSRICAVQGMSVEAAHFHRLHEEMNGNLHRAFFVPERGRYASFLRNGSLQHDCELTQALMFFCGAVPPGLAPSILEMLAAGQDGLIPVTLSHSIFKAEALMTMPDRFGRHVLMDLEQRWGSMVRKGATTFWETDLGAEDFDRAGSLCHGWSAAPAYLYRRYFPSLFHEPKSGGMAGGGAD
jgi:alpha-L-rhamnosidase